MKYPIVNSIKNKDIILVVFTDLDFYIVNKETGNLSCINDETKNTEIYEFMLSGMPCGFIAFKNIDDVLDFYSSREWQEIYNKEVNEHLQT